MGGFFNSITDGDGVVRSIPLVAEYKGQYYESLALAMFRVLTGLPNRLLLAQRVDYASVDLQVFNYLQREHELHGLELVLPGERATGSGLGLRHGCSPQG